MKRKMSHMYKELIDKKIRTHMPLHRLHLTKTVVDSVIGTTMQIKSMEDQVLRQQMARVSDSSKVIYNLCHTTGYKMGGGTNEEEESNPEDFNDSGPAGTLW